MPEMLEGCSLGVEEHTQPRSSLNAVARVPVGVVVTSGFVLLMT